MAKPVAIRTNWDSQVPCNLNADESTPPEPHKFPLTPPPTAERQASDTRVVERVLRIFNGIRCSGPGISGSPRIKLQREQFPELLSRLGEDQPLHDYVNDKVRWDYDPESEQLQIRMPSPVHDFFVASVAGEISKQLQTIIDEGGPASESAALITSGGSSRILLRADNSDDGHSVDSTICLQRQPDAQFQHCLAAYPGVVVEVSYSQNGNLRKLASEYIMNSNGNIKVVIGINVKYDGKESTVSLWRPAYVQEEGEEFDALEVDQVIKAEVFRTQDGRPANKRRRLSLNLSDFGPDELSDGYERKELSISYETLVNLLNRAEQIHQARESAAGLRGVESKRQIRKRKLRSSSPAEQLRSDDEAKRRRQEAQAEERTAASDKDYKPPSSGRRRAGKP
ncbi:hypothetical protein IFM51744_10672 [Aspergillus udagawae]|nr:hypothetical protein IFM51744_10672 [Aspergillus udagawae]